MHRHIFDHNRGWRRLSGLVLALCLFWTPSVTAAAGKSAAEYYVKSLPGAPEGPLLRMHAGHIEVSPESHGNLFFWHFQNRHLSDRHRTVLWFNGGPGCSSLDGALMEVGPYRVGADGQLVYNNGSWDEFANLLFVDQPVGVGFSYVDTNKYIHELDEMADNMVKFVDEFMNIFPEYIHDDLYLAGESYAGQYIPYIAQAMLRRNKDNPNSDPWNLKGLLIGNGWIAPDEQYLSYTKFSYQMGLLEPDSQKALAVEKYLSECQAKLAEDGAHDKVKIDECENVLGAVLDQTRDTHLAADKECINMYDVRLRDSYSSCGMNWPPDLARVTPYARRADVHAALNIDPQKQTGWQECSGAVGSAFHARKLPPSVRLLPELLAEVPIVLFSGDQDLICNHVGTEALIHSMAWGGGTGFELPGAPGTWAPRRAWTFEGQPAGFWQSARNLTYVLFRDASHMVPFDLPRRSRDMLDRFMGVDISGIGGAAPADSRLDGEKAPATSVAAGAPAAAEASAKGKANEAAVAAYYKSGEVVLVLLLLGLAAWGAWYLRARRRARRPLYASLGATDDDDDGYGAGAGDPADASASRMLKRMSHAFLQSPASPAGASFRDRHSPNGHARRPSRTHVTGPANGRPRDLEAADFDENELEELTGRGRAGGAAFADEDEDDDGGMERRSGGGEGKEAR